VNPLLEEGNGTAELANELIGDLLLAMETHRLVK